MKDSNGNVVGTVTFGTANMVIKSDSGHEITYGLEAGTTYTYKNGTNRIVFNSKRTTWEAFDDSQNPPVSVGTGTVS